MANKKKPVRAIHESPTKIDPANLPRVPYIPDPEPAPVYNFGTTLEAQPVGQGSDPLRPLPIPSHEARDETSSSTPAAQMEQPPAQVIATREEKKLAALVAKLVEKVGGNPIKWRQDKETGQIIIIFEDGRKLFFERE